MKFDFFGLGFLRTLYRMFEKPEATQDKPETIQEIAVKLLEEQLRLQLDHGPKERTIFMLGSKGVGKSTVINKFFDREEPTRPTLALEYSYGRRSNGSHHHAQKQVLNVWELGSLENAEQLLEVPLRTHGLSNFAAIIMVDLSQPQRVWLDLECAYRGLRDAGDKMPKASNTERVKKEHPDAASLELMPHPVVIVGGKYDLFMDFDPEVKKHVCLCLRSMAHLIGASLLFYSTKIPKLAKTLRDTISHLGFGSPSNPFRVHATDYNEALSIWFGTDSWERIGGNATTNVQRIGATFTLEVPQIQQIGGAKEKASLSAVDSVKDEAFRESIIDEMRAQKDEELQAIIRESQLRGQFETVAG